MTPHDFAELDLFITGPTYIRPEVKAAATLPEFGHRDAENEKRFKPIFQWLKLLAGASDDYTTMLFNGSGSTAMEAVLRSLAKDDETILNVSVGAFGDLWGKMGVVNGKRVEKLAFPAGEAVDLTKLEAALAATKPAVVTITHNETSTGVINDIHAACALVRRFGALPLVDGVSLFGGAPVDLATSQAAVYVTSTQKSLGLAAGFGIAFVHGDAFAKAETVPNRGFSSDILAQRGRALKFQTLTTPNTILANQLFVQLQYIVETEGIENRFARHLALRDMTHRFALSIPGYGLFAQVGRRSPTLTAVLPPEGVSFKTLKSFKEAMRAKGFLFDPGYGKLNEDREAQGLRPIFRIGHMGDITADMLGRYLDALGPVLTSRA